jgi:hypothetical protein
MKLKKKKTLSVESTAKRMSTAPAKTVPKVDQSVKVKAPVPPKSSMSVVNTVKSKKKKPRTEETRTKKLDKVKDKAMLEESAALELIAKMKTKSEKSNEDDHLAVYMSMYRQLKRIIRRTEKSCLKSKGGQGAYQLATLYTQLRETIADIRNLTDLSDHAELLIEKVMRPLFTTMVQNTSNSMYTIKLKIKDKLQEKRVRRTFEDIDEITIEAGKNLQDLYDRSCSDIKKILVGE